MRVENTETVLNPHRENINYYYLLQAQLTGEWQTVCSLVVRSRPYRSTTNVVCL